MEYLSLAMSGFRSEVIGFPFPWGAATKSRNSASGLLLFVGKKVPTLRAPNSGTIRIIYLQKAGRVFFCFLFFLFLRILMLTQIKV